jgi:hypothetical protein
MILDSHFEKRVFAPDPENPLPKEIPPRNFESTFGPLLVGMLSAETRLLLAKLRQSTANQRLAPSLLFSLYEAGHAADTAISSELARVFQRDIQLDYSGLESLCIRVAENFDKFLLDARAARDMLRQAEMLDDQGDGLRSFASVVIAMSVARRPIWLIDEPEAFLHPPQAYLMGSLLAKYSARGQQLFVSTHNVNVLRGILEKTTEVTIVRLTRQGAQNPCKVLSAERLKEILHSPLLSSSRVLDGLFYSAAVVTEADADSRLYHTVSTKLNPGGDVHFVNAANKQTVPRIVSLYKEMGVKCIGLADFDVINDSTEFRNHLAHLNVPAAEIDAAVSLQKEVLSSAHSVPRPDVNAELQQKLDILAKKVAAAQKPRTDTEGNESDDRIYRAMRSLASAIADLANPFQRFKELGRRALPEAIHGKFDVLDQMCRRHGLLINQYGELESMMTDYDLRYSTEKAEWITEALTRLPDCERNDQRIIWRFVALVHSLIGVEVKPPASET